MPAADDDDQGRTEEEEERGGEDDVGRRHQDLVVAQTKTTPKNFLNVVTSLLRLMMTK